MHQYKPPDYLVERLDCCEVGVSNWDLNPQPLCQSSVLYQTVGLQHRLCNCNVYCTVLVFGFWVFACAIFIFGICMYHFYFWYLHVPFLFLVFACVIFAVSRRPSAWSAAVHSGGQSAHSGGQSVCNAADRVSSSQTHQPSGSRSGTSVALRSHTLGRSSEERARGATSTSKGD